MEKIIRVALEAKFMQDVDALLDVVNNTPNPEHAVEVLLGIYEEPKFKANHKYTYKYEGEAFKDLDAKFIDYSPWNKSITVNVAKPKSVEIAILKENEDLINVDNYKQFQLSSDEYRNLDRDSWRWKVILTGEIQNVTEIIYADGDGHIYRDWLDTGC